MAPQLTRINGPAARGEWLWIIRAISSLPVPVSPRMRTGASDRATRLTRSKTACRAGIRADDDIVCRFPCVPAGEKRLFFGFGCRRHRSNFPQATVIFQGSRKRLQQKFHDLRVLAVEHGIVGRRHNQDAGRTLGIGQRPDEDIPTEPRWHENFDRRIRPSLGPR